MKRLIILFLLVLLLVGCGSDLTKVPINEEFEILKIVRHNSRFFTIHVKNDNGYIDNIKLYKEEIDFKEVPSNQICTLTIDSYTWYNTSEKEYKNKFTQDNFSIFDISFVNDNGKQFLVKIHTDDYIDLLEEDIEISVND